MIGIGLVVFFVFIFFLLLGISLFIDHYVAKK